jgi:hypothetical protein
MAGNEMRLAIESLIVVVAFFGVMAAINYNEQYASLVAQQNNPTGYCNVSFGSSKATMACNRISRLDDK